MSLEGEEAGGIGLIGTALIDKVAIDAVGRLAKGKGKRRGKGKHHTKANRKHKVAA